MNPNFNGAMFPFAQPNQVQNENNIHAIHRPVQYKNGVGMNGPSVYHVQQPSCVNVPFQNLGGFCASGQVTQQQQQQARALNDVTNLHYNMRTTQPEQSRFSFFTKVCLCLYFFDWLTISSLQLFFELYNFFYNQLGSNPSTTICPCSRNPIKPCVLC